MITREDLNRARDLLTEIVKKNNRLAVMYARVTGGAIDYHEKVQSIDIFIILADKFDDWRYIRKK